MLRVSAASVALLSLLAVIGMVCSDLVTTRQNDKLKNASHAQAVKENNHNSPGYARENPRSRHLIVATIESPPFIMKRKLSSSVDAIDSNQTKFEYYGYCIDFFVELIKHMPYNITYEIYHVADDKFGSKAKQVFIQDGTNGTSVVNKIEYWTGLVGDLQRGKAHVALAPLSVMAERELVIDYTVPYYDLVGIQILLKKPEVPQDWFKFLTVLDNEVWLSISVSYFITSFVIFLFDRLSPYSHKNLARIRRMRDHKKEIRLKSHHNINHSSQPHNHISSHPLATNLLSRLEANANKIDVKSQQQQQRHQYQGKHTLEPTSSGPLSVNHAPVELGLGGLSQENDKSVWTSSARRVSRDYMQMLQIRDHNNVGASSFWTDPSATHVGEDNESYQSESEDVRPGFGLRDSLWFCITSLTPQGGGEAPQNLSGRIVAGAWWLFCFIIIASYTANLAAFLTVSRLDLPIESLDDLAKQYRIKYAPINGTAEHTYFERMAYIEEIFYNIWKEMSLNDSLSEEERTKFAVWDYPIGDKYSRIWAQIQDVGMPADFETAIKRVKRSTLDNGFALLADANFVKHAVMTDCSLKAVGDEFSRKPVALGIRKGEDQLKYDMSYAILQLINQRFMEVLREKWWTNNPSRVQCENRDESEGIDIENIGGVFIIIVGGIVFAFLIWSVEKFIYKTKVEISKNMLEQI